MNLADVFLFTLNSVLPLIILIILGYILKIKGFFSKEFLKIGNKTVFKVLLPILLFKNIADIDDLSEIRMDVVGYVMIVIAILFIIGLIITKFIPDPKQKGVIHQCIFRSNFALIGVPLAELIAGQGGIRMAAILSLFTIPVFNILAVVVLSVYKDEKSQINVKKIITDIAKNPLILGVLCGLLFTLIKNLFISEELLNMASKVSFLNTAISYIARSATPLALLVLGGQFDFEQLKGYKKQIILGLAGRNVFAPLVGVGIAAVLTLNGVVNFTPGVFAALIALFGTPVAVASAIMAEAMDNDGQLGGQLVVWTTLFSVVSLSVTIAVARAVWIL